MRNIEAGDEGPGGDDARGEDDAKTHRDKAKAAIRRYLSQATQLDEAKKATYRAAAEAVIDAMGPEALKRWNENLKSITFYPDTESINQFVRSLGPEFANVTGVRGVCIHDPNQPRLCSLHLNGGSDTGDAFRWDARDGYAHEFGHVIDWGASEPGPLSITKAWCDAWAENGEEICGRLREPNRGAREGFADFAILGWGRPEEARKQARSYEFWRERGLVFDSSEADPSIA
jgi:hypothetical protein